MQPKSAATTFRRICNPGGRAYLWFGLLGLACHGLLPAALGQIPIPITRIVITNVGPAAVNEAYVRANIRSKPGDIYNRNVVDDDVRNLYGTGFFANISVADERSVEGITLYFFLQGKLKLVSIQFSGNNKYKDKKLRKKIASKVGEPLNEQKLFEDQQEIIKLYQKAGYPDTVVKPRVVPDERAGQGTVIFEITESPKVKILQVSFPGSQDIPEKKLRKAVKTKKRWMFSWLTGSGVLKKDQLEEDKDRLAVYYQDKGYIDYELKDIQYNYVTSNRLDLQFVVHEGSQYKVGAISFKGFTLFPTNEVLAKLKMNIGDIFTMKGLNNNVETIRDLYGGKGYIDARIRPLRSANIRTGTMDLVFEVDERTQSSIEKIEIKGNIKTQDRVLRRELAVSPGEVFDMTKVKLSRQRLEGLNYFSRVDTQPEPTDVPDRRNLVVTVEEQSTGNFNIGAGFSSVDNLLGFVEVSQGNFDLFNPPWFMGAGQKIRLRAQIGTERQDYVLTFIEPWFLGRKLEFSTELYHRDLLFLSPNDLYEETLTGGRLGLRKALGSDFLIGGLHYTLENVDYDVDDDASAIVKELTPDSLVSKVGATLAYDTRNNALLPDKGFRVELKGELGGGPFGGDTDVYSGEIRTSHYFKGFGEGHVLEILGRAGYVDHYGDSDEVPMFERYFLGGLESLRGYDYREVGPVDVQDEEPIGGNYYWYASAEYSIPIIERVRFAVFYDIGMAYANDSQFNTQSYNDNWGVGIRLNLPIGPLRLDYGVPRHATKGVNDSSGQFQFSAGWNRDF